MKYPLDISFDYDINKLKYNLALTYAKTKLEYALNNNLIPEELCPRAVSEHHYLLDNFLRALHEYDSLSDTSFR